MKTGMEALAEAGFPPQFVAEAMVVANPLNISLAFRVGQRPASRGFPVVGKPSTLKTKSTPLEYGIPFIAGHILQNQALFGRPGSDPLPSEGFSKAQLSIRLRELLNDATKGIYHVEYKDGCLAFHALQAIDSQRKNIEFKISLSEGVSPTVSVYHPPGEELKIPAQPAFWNIESMGDFTTHLDLLYPVSVKEPDKEWDPVYAVAQMDGRIVTVDADLLWMAIPANLSKDNSNTLYDSTDLDQYTALIQRYIELSAKLQQNMSNTMLESYTRLNLSDVNTLEEIAEFARNAGHITPYELLLVTVINRKFTQCFPQFVNLLQHGADTGNPGAPSSLAGKILHVHNGLPVLTEGEDDLIKLVMCDGYLDCYYFPVHSQWNLDMKHWGQVVYAQLQKGLFVSPNTVNAFYEVNPSIPRQVFSSYSDGVSQSHQLHQEQFENMVTKHAPSSPALLRCKSSDASVGRLSLQRSNSTGVVLDSSRSPSNFFSNLVSPSRRGSFLGRLLGAPTNQQNSEKDQQLDAPSPKPGKR